VACIRERREAYPSYLEAVRRALLSSARHTRRSFLQGLPGQRIVHRSQLTALTVEAIQPSVLLHHRQQAPGSLTSPQTIGSSFAFRDLITPLLPLEQGYRGMALS
jgi:hypothetical protein